MPAFITAVLAWIAKSRAGQLILGMLTDRLVSFVRGIIAKYKTNKDADESANKSVEALKNAKTKEEIDKAADSALDNL